MRLSNELAAFVLQHGDNLVPEGRREPMLQNSKLIFPFRAPRCAGTLSFPRLVEAARKSLPLKPDNNSILCNVPYEPYGISAPVVCHSFTGALASMRLSYIR